MIAAALLFAVLPLAPDGEAQDESTLVRHDLRPVTPRFDAASSWSEGLVPRLGHPLESVPAVGLEDLYAPASPEVVLDVVTRVLGDDLMGKGRSIVLDGESSLLVLAPAAVQARVSAVLDALGRALGSSERVRLDVFTLDRGGDDELLAAHELSVAEADSLMAALVAAGARHERHQLELLPGRTTVLDQTREVPFLHSFDSEIAQSSIAFDPVVVGLQVGLRLVARGARVGTGIALSLVLESTELEGEVQTLPLNVRGGVADPREGGMQILDGPKQLQTVDLVSRSVALSTMIPNDRVVALASELRQGTGARRQVVLLRRESGSASPFYSKRFGSLTLMMVNSEVFALPRFQIGYAAYADGQGRHPFLQANLIADPSLFLFDWLKYRFSVWRRLGPWAVVVTDPAWDDQAGAELEALFASLDAGAETVGVEIDLVDGDGSATARWSLPLLAGSECGAVLGRSTTFVADYTVEVAHHATLSVPEVAPLFDGLVLSLGVSRTTPRVVEARGLGQRVQRPIPGRGGQQWTGPFTGAIEMPEILRIEFDERADLGAGGTLRVGADPEGQEGSSGTSVRIGVR